MTSQTFFLILKDNYFRSVEFNWDMYPTWYWDEWLRILEKVEDEKEFEFMVNKFNKEHHNYDDEEVVFEWNNEVLFRYLDLSKVDYFNFWFSDWIFIKNKSWKIKQNNYY